MANRRMFSKTIVSSSKFIRMPATSRLLYYDLGMAADDDGYCEWFPVLQMTGAKEQDMEVLHANGLVYVMDKEVLVVKDWKENNFIRSDRYTPSKYLGKYESLVELPSGIPTVDPGQDRLGKVNTPAIAEEVIETLEENTQPKHNTKYPHALEVFKWFPKPQKSWESMKSVQEREYAEYLYERGEEKVKFMLAYCARHKDDIYCPQPNKPSQLEKKWEDIRAYHERNR